MSAANTGPKQRRLTARVPDDIIALVNAECERDAVTPSEVIRKALMLYYYGQAQGPDIGYMQGRSVGARLLVVLMREVMADLPPSYEEAYELLQSKEPPRW